MDCFNLPVAQVNAVSMLASLEVRQKQAAPGFYRAYANATSDQTGAACPTDRVQVPGAAWSYSEIANSIETLTDTDISPPATGTALASDMFIARISAIGRTLPDCSTIDCTGPSVMPAACAS